MAKVILDLGAVERLSQRAAEQGLKAALSRGEAILRGDILSRPGTGRVYGSHRASAPGQPPAPDTGELRNKTQADSQIREEGDTLVGRIVANSEKALALEVGTERMAARPFMSRLLTEHAEDLRKAFIEGARQ